jgi:hypothetical protein
MLVNTRRLLNFLGVVSLCLYFSPALVEGVTIAISRSGIAVSGVGTISSIGVGSISSSVIGGILSPGVSGPSVGSTSSFPNITSGNIS